MDWPWGHLQTCPCSVCFVLRRISHCVGRAAGAPGFLEFATRELRQTWGALEDFVDRIPPRLPRGGESGLVGSEGTAPPVTASGAAAKEGSTGGEIPAGDTDKAGASVKEQAKREGLLGLQAAPKASPSSGATSSRPPAKSEPREVKAKKEQRQESSRSRHRRREKSKRKKRSRSRRRSRKSTPGSETFVSVKVEQGSEDEHREPVEETVEASPTPERREHREERSLPSAPSRPDRVERGPSRSASRASRSRRREVDTDRRGSTPTLLPREPSHPPPNSTSRGGRYWQGPIRAPRHHYHPPGRGRSKPPSKGAKKRETQKEFKAYRDAHGTGEGFYQQRRERECHRDHWGDQLQREPPNQLLDPRQALQWGPPAAYFGLDLRHISRILGRTETRLILHLWSWKHGPVGSGSWWRRGSTLVGRLHFAEKFRQQWWEGVRQNLPSFLWEAPTRKW